METKVITMKSPSQSGRKLALFGALAIAVGAFLPWGVFENISISGMKGDGAITLWLAILMIVLLLIKKIPVLVGLIFGVITGSIAVVDLVQIQGAVNSSASVLASLTGADAFAKATGSVGVGLYITVIGAALIVIGTITQQTAKPSTEK